MLNSIYISSSYDPYENLALEQILFNQKSEAYIFYLWQNENTVVVGKNQNAWKECNLALLEQEGGKLARRPSGGGAVYHDLGNLNFTFITPRSGYDVMRQLGVIKSACASFGIDAEFSGRNDLTCGGAKFSGNAFLFTTDRAMHHGTILVDTDFNKLSRYLAPPVQKLQAKGIESVRSRVVNLVELNRSLNIENMKRALLDAFIKDYGPSRLGQASALDGDALKSAREKFGSWQWRLGTTPSFDISLEKRFLFGSVELSLSLKKGIIEEAAVYSDSMEGEFIAQIAPSIIGCEFNSAKLSQRIRELGGSQANEIADWIEKTGF